MTRLIIAAFLVALALLSSPVATAGLPFPAPDLQRCRSTEDCCTSRLDNPAHFPAEFQFPSSSSPVRLRPATNLVTSEYAAKLQKAYQLMRALPDSDGRSLKNQAKLHCAYCDNSFYFEGNEYPLEIHQNWLFLPWHRLFLYFHERILATLLDDDSFALPFWYWDDSSTGLGSGGLLPAVYAGYGDNNTSSSLFDPDRNACAQRPHIVDLVNPFVGCVANKTDEELRSEKAHVMYTHLVAGAVTPSLFFGMPYRLGDRGGVGGGTLEVKPHAAVHLWVNVRKMLTNRLSALDPIFFAHHANVDRLWTLWTGLPGGVRHPLSDPDWLHTRFTFFDERGRLVYASVAQSLDIHKLRYKYQEVPVPWARGAVDNSSSNPASWPACYKHSTDILLTTISKTEPFQNPLTFHAAPVTFRVERKPAVNCSTSSRSSHGEEVLQLKGKLNWSEPMAFTAFLNLPGATENPSLQACREYLGSFSATPHQGSSPHIPRRLKWRVALRQKLWDLEAQGLVHVAITLVAPSFPNQQTIKITSAKIFHIKD